MGTETGFNVDGGEYVNDYCYLCKKTEGAIDDIGERVTLRRFESRAVCSQCFPTLNERIINRMILHELTELRKKSVDMPERIQAISLGPNDRLAVYYSRHLSSQAVENIQRYMNTWAPGVPVVVLQDGMQLGVLREECQDHPAANDPRSLSSHPFGGAGCSAS